MTKESLRASIEEHFGKIPDQRVVTRSSHKLVDIIAIAYTCAVTKGQRITFKGVKEYVCRLKENIRKDK